MFKKLLSNLPFNPSLIGQVSFYAKRIKREESLRRTGLAFVVLAMVVQMFAIASPSEPTLAASSNDIIWGGFTSKEQAVNYCRSNTQEFATILAYHNVSCEALAGATVTHLKSTDYNNRLYSMGRNPQGPVITRTGKPTNEFAVGIDGKNYYMRLLSAWDSYSHSTYQVLRLTNAQGQVIYILFNCANIVTIDRYTPPPPPPPPPTDACPNIPGNQPPGANCDVCPNIPGVQLTTAECDVCPNIPGEQSNRNECYPCPEAETDLTTTACLELSKSASNQTQNIKDANGTTAAANDVIIYTLTVKNKGAQAVADFIVEENMADVLEYADIVDLHGGEINDENIVSWPKQNIPANGSIEKQITVKVKDPIPQTPVSASDRGSYDMVMTNVFYGSSVNIELPPSVTKTTELVVQQLPETGPGTTLLAGFGLTAVFSYFVARSRLMAKELEIVKTDFASTGGA